MCLGRVQCLPLSGQYLHQIPDESSIEDLSLPVSTGLPKGEADQPMDDDMRFRMVIERNALTIQPIRLGRTLTIGTYELCRTASTEYIFINDCATDRQQYIQDWLKTTPPSRGKLLVQEAQGKQ